MEPNVFAAIGGLFIGLIAGAAGSYRGVRHAQPGEERRDALLWSGVFTLALASFMAGVCMVPRHSCWLFGAPMLMVVVIAVYAMNRSRAGFQADRQPEQ
jgi:uncharacterized membrane protein